MNFVESTLKDSNYSETTMRNRISALSKLQLTKENYAKVLNNIDSVDDSNKALNTRITNVFHVMALLRALPASDEVNNLTRLYTDRGNVLKKKQRIEQRQNKMSTRESETYIPLEELQSKLNSKEPDFEALVDNPQTKDDTVKFYKRYENHLLLSMYINMPAIRNDLYALKIANKKTELNEQENFILISSRAIYLQLSKYKTAARYGTVRIDVGKINDRLVRNLIALRKALKFTSDYLFNHVSVNGLSKINNDTVLIQRIKKTSTEYFGKTQTINSFRHAWEIYIQRSPEYINATIEEREAIHQKLLHSLGTALYYNRAL